MAEVPPALDKMRMPNGDIVNVPKEWDDQQRHDYVEEKFPGAYEDASQYEPEEGTAGYAMKDLGLASHDRFEESVAAIPGLPGTLIDLGKRGLRNLGFGIPEDEPGDPLHVPTGEELLSRYREARGRPIESYEPKTELGKDLSPLAGYAVGGVGRLAGAVPRIATNVLAPAAGEVLGGKLGKKFGLEEAGETVGALLGWGGATGLKASQIPKRSGLPTGATLATQADEAINAANNAGVVVFRKSMKRFADDLEPLKKHIDETEHPSAYHITKVLEKKMQPDATGKFMDTVTLEDLEMMRKNIKNIAKNPKEQHLYFEIRRKFDKFMENLHPSDVAKGNSKEGVEALIKFRKLYNRRMKTEEIEDLLSSSDLRDAVTEADLGEILKRKFATFVDPMGQGKFNKKMYTPAEWDMFNEVAKGRSPERMLRWLGKYAPTKLRGAVTTGGLFGLLGAKVAVPVAATTGSAKWVANRMSRANAQRAYDSVRGGVPLDAPPSAGVPAQVATGAQMFPFDLPDDIKDYGQSEQDLEDEEKLRREQEGQQ